MACLTNTDLLWHDDRSDVPNGDGPLLARDTNVDKVKQYARARDIAHVLRNIRLTRGPALYEHAGDAPCTLYFVVQRETDEKPRAVLRRSLAWIVRFLDAADAVGAVGAGKAGKAGEAETARKVAFDPHSMLVLSGTRRGSALYHVLVPSLYLADHDARAGISTALRAYNALEASDVDAEAYGPRAMLRTIGSSELGARCPLRPIEEYPSRPDDEEYLINTIRADARPLQLCKAKCDALVAALTKRDAVAAVADVVDNECDAVEDTKCEAVAAVEAGTKREAVAAVAAVEAVEAVVGVEAAEADSISTTPTTPTTPSLRQSVSILVKMRESIDWLIERPGGACDTIESLGALSIAKEMLDGLVAASRMSEQQTPYASRCFEHAEQAPVPLMTLSRLDETHDTHETHETHEAKLRAWVERNYAHLPLCDKDSGTKLEAIFGAYKSSTPPVHTPLLGKINFAKMLVSIYAGVGPHKNKASTERGIYLLR